MQSFYVIASGQGQPNAPSGRRSGALILIMQAVVALAGAAWLFVVPPAEGMMMLVPLGRQAARSLPALALRGDVRLVGTGPVPGSLLVWAERSTMARRLLPHGVLILASPPGGCGAQGATA